MFFPEALYLLSQRDQQVTWLDPVVFDSNQSLAQVNVTAAYTVPTGRILILQNVSVEFAAGAGQTVTWGGAVIRPVPTPSPYGILMAEYFAAGAVKVTVNWSGSIIVPSGWLVQSDAIFNAGANPNYAALAMHGILIPVGNVQRL